ncbi:GntR family transcriptional regulator [Aminobacterium sp. MB27-C1]|jgi:DNA-binding GntR family transcriptional regulator|uniref:GntR family transcriptional regulator n=1 Tax=unclassified Aminobacterium TaxID=2685012 RepID=UPI001BCD84D5|nr:MULTISPECIES: GntR family transcriptional regulator [unclassified Aminobacterium]MEA4878303.1 GntR family transcriptional regulator [Aminobacterium sp.]WMI70861.1 GntR family transcriptional regulator [Aminobacterium sp. MB27-C1]
MDHKPLTPATNQGLRQIVYERLKDAIVSGIFKPGSKLSEIELAEQLAVSRTPVREAIRQLSQTGLITLTPRRGAFVTLPSLKDAADLYELRQALEVIAIENVCENPPIKELQLFREVFSEMSSKTPHEEYLSEDRRFHCFLYECSGNKYLHRTLNNIVDLINLCRPYSMQSEPTALSVFLKGHLSIIDAVLAGDCDKAKAEMSEHIEDTKKSLLTFLKLHPEDYTNED